MNSKSRFVMQIWWNKNCFLTFLWEQAFHSSNCFGRLNGTREAEEGSGAHGLPLFHANHDKSWDFIPSFSHFVHPSFCPPTHSQRREDNLHYSAVRTLRLTRKASFSKSPPFPFPLWATHPISGTLYPLCVIIMTLYIGEYYLRDLQ